jgi:hypothetical protein
MYAVPHCTQCISLAGFQPDRPSVDDGTPLQMIELLLNAGANPNLQLKKELGVHPEFHRRAEDGPSSGNQPLDAQAVEQVEKRSRC